MIKHSLLAASLAFSPQLALAELPPERQHNAIANMGSEDQHCLAQNVYFEARNQSAAGKLAVTHVVLNRVNDTRYPNTVCEVVKQAYLKSNGEPRLNKCQFSWYCDGLSDKPREKDAWITSVFVSVKAISLFISGYDIADGSTHYHAKNVSPYWSKEMSYISSIDDHHFYKWEK